MKKVLLYVHGKNGCADEANHYRRFFRQAEVIGCDYQGETPWDTKDELVAFYQKLSAKYSTISVIANSIGAYYVMNALSDKNIEHAYFISPIVDMEKLIYDMMLGEGIGEEKLAQNKKITTSAGEVLSWQYLCYVRSHPLIWHVPTDILYGEKDRLTTAETMAEFAYSHQATLTIMKDGEHWFHTAEQMDFLDKWLLKCTK